MKVSVFGLGYVGCVSMGCLAKMGNTVVGVDINKSKVDLINSGKSTIVEKGLDPLIENGVKQGLISATMDIENAVKDSEIAILCVGTPNLENGHLDMQYIEKVSEEIGAVLATKEDFLTVSIRSTVMPGTNKKIIGIIEQSSGKKHDVDFAVVSNPEFLREGNAIDDFFSPPYTVIASYSPKGVQKISELYSFLDSPIEDVEVEAAELIKLLNNSFHALKVAFGNEVGRICKGLNVDSHKLMDLFVKDTQLNISPTYLKPGFSYGGSCLPKDLIALNSIAHDQYLKLPIIEAVSSSNTIHTDFVYDKIIRSGKTKVGIYGLSFKAGTDDLRYSPSLEVVERLIGKGIKVAVYDKNVNTSRLVGKNKEFLFNQLPHINQILTSSLEDLLSENDLIVITQKVPEQDAVLFKKMNNAIIDLVRTAELEDLENYEGIGW